MIVIRRWCAYAGGILLVVLVLSGCEPSNNDGGLLPRLSEHSSTGGAYKAFVQWSVLPAPWYIEYDDGASDSESWDHDSKWSVGSLMLTHSSGEKTIDTDGVHRFASKWNSIQGMEVGRGDVSLTLNKSESIITAFDVYNTERSGSNYSVSGLKGTDIPLVSGSTADRVFEVTGSATCSHIVAEGAYMESHNFLGIGGILNKDDKFVCNENSFIRIRLIPQ